MIGKLTGTIDYRSADHLLLDVQGVGYLVYCSERTLASLPPKGSKISLYTDLLVREDNLQLFGFLTLADREWHRLLITVQGVGAKAALAIAGTLGTDGISSAITLGDVAAIKSAPGVGPKIAQRVVTELKDKAHQIMAMGSQGTEPAFAPAQAPAADVIEMPQSEDAVPKAAPAQTVNAGAQADALSALSNLGYGHSEAVQAILQVQKDDPQLDAAQLIKAALKRLAPEK